MCRVAHVPACCTVSVCTCIFRCVALNGGVFVCTRFVCMLNSYVSSPDFGLKFVFGGMFVGFVLCG